MNGQDTDRSTALMVAPFIDDACGYLCRANGIKGESRKKTLTKAVTSVLGFESASVDLVDQMRLSHEKCELVQAIMSRLGSIDAPWSNLGNDLKSPGFISAGLASTRASPLDLI
jgi:hypothetical protein